MATRLEVQELLETIFESKNVYYQRPGIPKMQYPAILYSLSDLYNLKADGSNYIKRRVYDVIVVDYRPDNPVIEKLNDLDYCRYSRHYVMDGLNHDVFRLYF